MPVLNLEIFEHSNMHIVFECRGKCINPLNYSYLSVWIYMLCYMLVSCLFFGNNIDFCLLSNTAHMYIYTHTHFIMHIYRYIYTLVSVHISIITHVYTHISHTYCMYVCELYVCVRKREILRLYQKSATCSDTVWIDK